MSEQNMNLNEDAMPTIITLLDEENKEHAFEILDYFEVDEEAYIAVEPYFENPADALEDELAIIIFRVGPEDEEGLETFDIFDDEEEYSKAWKVFEKRYEKMWEEMEK